MKKLIFIIVLAAIVIGVCAFMFLNNQKKETNETQNEVVQEFSDAEQRIVEIKNNIIENEDLIDEFIEKANYTNVEKQELIIKQDEDVIKVTYTPGEYANQYDLKSDGDESDLPQSDGTPESNKTVYGYYTLTINRKIKGEYPLGSHSVKKQISDNEVTVYFDAPLIEYVSIPEICKYNLNK